MQKIFVVILFVAAAIFGAFVFWKKETFNEKKFIDKKPGLKADIEMLQKSGAFFSVDIPTGTFPDGQHPVTFTIYKDSDKYSVLSQDATYAKFLKFCTVTDGDNELSCLKNY